MAIILTLPRLKASIPDLQTVNFTSKRRHNGQNLMLQCIYFKFKTVRNFLCAMNIQFLYGWTGSSTVRQPKYPVGLQFCSYIVQFQREYNILLIQHSRAQVFKPSKKSFMGRNLFCKELDFFISVCLAFISEQLKKFTFI